jgi:hypothetical protein
MSDDHDLERRLSRYRQAGPSADFEARLGRSLDADAAAVRFPLPRHAFALAASVLILLTLSFSAAGKFESTRLRALLTGQSSVRLTEEERAIERELGPEVLALKRQLDAAHASARSRRSVSALDPSAWEKVQ